MISKRKRLLLGSGGFRTASRKKFWRDEVDSFLGDIEEVLFIPYALQDGDAYLRLMTRAGYDAGRKLRGIHRMRNPRKAVEEAHCIYVGGGNTFRLLAALYRERLIEPIQRRVRSGVPYIGVSAGTNVACPAIKTTNDMPIAAPPKLDALGLIPFQINPHYFEGAIHFRRGSRLIEYAGETRDDRIREYHEMNALPVIGLWEGSALRIENGRVKLLGESGARVFHKGKKPRDFQPPRSLSL